MKINLISAKEEFDNRESHAICLGMFDGVHIGHRSLIEKTVCLAKSNGIRSAVTTFLNTRQCDSADSAKHSNGRDANAIMLFEQQMELIGRMGVDTVFAIRFDDDFKKITSAEFVREYLAKGMKVKKVLCGEDFRFGRDREGTVKTLWEYASQYDYDVTVVPLVEAEGAPVSSSRIRRGIANGDIRLVNSLLGHTYFLEGAVMEGNKIGATLSYPTINIEINEKLCMLKKGVYATKTLIDGVVYDSVTNIGEAPTFSLKKRAVSETFIMGYEGNLYNRFLKVYFFHFLREQKRFKSTEELVRTIYENEREARVLLTDDTICL